MLWGPRSTQLQNFREPASRSLPMSGTKSVKRPQILPFVMAQDIEIAVVGTNAEICGIRRVPPAINFIYLKLTATKDETKRALVGAKPRVALDAHFAHLAPTGRRPSRR